MSPINRLGQWPSGDNTGIIVASTAIATAALLTVLRNYLWPAQPKVLRSPLRTVLPKLSPDEFDKLEYKPDNFPGARDVETPYGSIRVYEWGPLTGDKVLFVHGISTSCITLTKLANAFVNERGCRVMLFDLFGRGYSDNPSDLPHDERLYTTQILLALASSPDVSWTGPQAFKLVGYSLGGGIAVHFATSFPHLVSSLLLLAPAGLIRPESFGTVTRTAFTSDYIPWRFLRWVTSRRLKKPIRSQGKRGRRPNAKAATITSPSSSSSSTLTTPSQTTPLLPPKPSDPIPSSGEDRFLLAETTDPLMPLLREPRNALEKRVLRAVHWQLANHAGFVPAFMSCIRHAPLFDQHASWAKLADREPSTTCVVLGEEDELIDPEDFRSDVGGLLGEGWDQEKITVVRVPGGHDFPMTFAGDVLGEVWRVWGWGERRVGEENGM
ncbi:hypothetical protein VTI74DRAFT_10385 [Chaetomium olivicolor]